MTNQDSYYSKREFISKVSQVVIENMTFKDFTRFQEEILGLNNSKDFDY
tara:strand:+ start:52 stop:198 length:147 start_codon:yes stop_codon:yes gene_type:complete